MYAQFSLHHLWMFVCTSLFLFMCVCANRDLKWLKQASTKNFQHCLDDVRYKSVSHSEVCFLSLSSNSPSLQICIAEIYMEKKKLHTQLHPPHQIICNSLGLVTIYYMCLIIYVSDLDSPLLPFLLSQPPQMLSLYPEKKKFSCWSTNVLRLACS